MVKKKRSPQNHRARAGLAEKNCGAFEKKIKKFLERLAGTFRYGMMRTRPAAYDA
jgi:hypothetical protein